MTRQNFKILRKFLGRKILGGPFRSMRYMGQNCCSTLMPKILGTYEMELHEFLLPLLMRPDVSLLDVGAAEGYYTAGALFVNPSATAIAFEMDPLAQKQLKALVDLNSVSSRVSLCGECNSGSIRELSSKVTPSLMIMDVEGAELQLITEETCVLLSSASMVIEVHPWVHSELGALLRERMSATHVAREIPARCPAITDITLPFWRWIARLSPSFKARLINERPDGMSWIIATPRG